MIVALTVVVLISAVRPPNVHLNPKEVPMNKFSWIRRFNAFCAEITWAIGIALLADSGPAFLGLRSSSAA